tara:strand:- start:88 stop:663 length:576 start_codon:yes stop_codon:yes gene_type:complete
MMKIEIKPESWFPSMIFHCKINTKFCDDLEEKVLVDKDNWTRQLKNVNALTTGWDGLKQYQELRDLCKFICESILPKIGESQTWKYNNWNTKEAWINFYQKGDSAKMHHHGFADFCGVLIVSPGDGNLIFSKTELIESKTKPFENIKDEQINEVKGRLILFPAYLYHTVTDCKKDRITIALNFSNDPVKEL